MTVKHKSYKQFFLAGIFLLLTACSSNPSVNQNNGPILLQEVTLALTNALPTRPLTNTPSPTTSMLEVPQQVQITVESGFVLVTPTLPPSKTPTITPTITPTFTPTIAAPVWLCLWCHTPCAPRVRLGFLRHSRPPRSAGRTREPTHGHNP